MRTWDALYMSDFFVRNTRTLNTLCLFYDRVFMHDHFGVASCFTNEEIFSEYDGTPSEDMIRFLWDSGTDMDSCTRASLRKASSNRLDALVLKGVAQGLGRYGLFSPAFIVDFAARYAAFMRRNSGLLMNKVLCYCYTSGWRSVFSPDVGSETDDRAGIAAALVGYKRACLLEQDNHKLPLVSDSEEDLVPWDRTKDLLQTALAMAAIPSRVPTIADVNPEDILEAREQLKDFLPAFRNTVLEGCWEVASVAREASMDEVRRVAQLYYDTKIQPGIDDLEAKLGNENDTLLRKLLERGADKTALLAKCLDPTEPLSKWDLLSSGVKSLLDVDAALREKARVKSPYEFLVRLPQALR